ncbi:hypothetical protein BDW67DRAFT_170659 [Aspergillus spinulosporus]
MKVSPQPASVHDVNEHDDPILHTKRSATRVSKRPRHSDPGPRLAGSKYGNDHKTQADRKAKEEAQPSLIIGKSRCHGPIKTLVTTYKGKAPLTIFSTSKDQTEQGNEIEGACFRKIFLTDETEILNPTATYERQRCVKLVILISHADEIYENPTIFVEQRVHGRGSSAQRQTQTQTQTVAHELMFGKVVQLGVEYLFPGCGDEDRTLGKRDLFVRFQSLDESVFSQYINRARWYGYDVHESVRIEDKMLETGVEYIIPSPTGTGAGSCIGFLDGTELRSLLKAKKTIPQPQPPSSRYGRRDSSEEIELIKLSFRGRGKWTEDRQHGGDLILHFVYCPSNVQS